MNEDDLIRRAEPEDAPWLARLIDMAGEGIPAWLWSSLAQPGESPFEVGARRAAREEGGFSYRNASVVLREGNIAGMLLDYAQPAEIDTGNLAGEPEVTRPLIILESLAPATWYVNAVAVFEEYRGLGLGRRLMDLSEAHALAAGCARMSLIVAEENRGAKGLYGRMGYRDVARRPTVPFPGFELTGDWVLMIKEL